MRAEESRRRRATALEMKQAGAKLCEVGARFGVTKERARQMINIGQEEEARLARPVEALDDPIDNLWLPTRARGCFRRQGLKTVRELLEFIQRTNLDGLRNFGRTTRREVYTALLEAKIRIPLEALPGETAPPRECCPLCGGAWAR